MTILITGIGVVSPLGVGARATMDRLVAGDRAFRTLTLFDSAGCRSSLAAEVDGLRVEDVAPRDRADGWSRSDAMAVVAAREALAQARLDPRRLPTHLAVGGTTAGMYETEDFLAELGRDPDALCSPSGAAPAHPALRRMLSHPLSAPADRLQEVVGPFRQARTLCSACSSGSNALLLAASWIDTGRAERVLVGATDGLCRLTYVGFSSLGALSPDPCRPFDVDRAGLNLGEGAAFLVLESDGSARARGADPIVELRGWAVGAEAHHITNPEASGATAARVIGAALARGGLTPADIDYVNAHGTATRHNDAMETAALHRCLGAESARVLVSSSKGQIGHTLGAAGAIEAAITALAIARGVAPPTGGLERIDPECALAHVRAAIAGPLRAAVSSSFGFGGSDSVVVMCQAERFPPRPLSAPRRVLVSAAATAGALGVLATDAGHRYLEPPGSVAPEALDFKDHLDLDKARRIDRAGRFTAAAMQAAMRDAELTGGLEHAGAIVGLAFGAVDACSAYIHRVYDKGAKLASPAVFPNLLPSSPVAHASIYLGLGGPVFANADLAATSESAMVTAVELIAAGEADAIFAGGVEVASRIAELVLRPLCDDGGIERAHGAREGSAVLLFEADHALARRGRAPVAEVRWCAAWRGEPNGELARLAPPPARAAVLAARLDARLDRWLATGGWAAVPRYSATAVAGDHECAGGFAAAAAVSALARGELDAALIVGAAPDRGYALLLSSVSGPPPQPSPQGGRETLVHT